MGEHVRLIKNGIVVDGTGSEPTQADVAIRGGVIAEVDAGLSGVCGLEARA
jgi:N-acyl-D-aspartate/D-glutamate deacylase